MNGFLLDTNTVSEMVSLKPNPRVLNWIAAADERRLFLSALTLGEIRQGVAALPQSKKRSRLELWLEVDLQERFAGGFLGSMRLWQIAGGGLWHLHKFEVCDCLSSTG